MLVIEPSCVKWKIGNNRFFFFFVVLFRSFFFFLSSSSFSSSSSAAAAIVAAVSVALGYFRQDLDRLDEMRKGLAEKSERIRQLTCKLADNEQVMTRKMTHATLPCLRG